MAQGMLVAPENQHARVVLREAIHLREELADELGAGALAAVLALGGERLELVEEEDGGRRLAGLLEERVQLALRLADVHVEDVGDGDVEEGGLALAGGGARQQRLAAARRAVEEDAAAGLLPEALEEAGLLEGEDDALADLLS